MFASALILIACFSILIAMVDIVWRVSYEPGEVFPTAPATHFFLVKSQENELTDGELFQES